ncbi:MAG: type II toxin-antitoxin system PemK/MazF family toxin [Terrimicrobiaceae bacterium]
MARIVPKRGEIWLADLGRVQKVRPVLVLSVAYKDDERAVVTFVSRTTSLRGTDYEVDHIAPRFDKGAFDAQGLNSLPDVQLIRRLAVCDAATLPKVEQAVKLWLGL